MTPEKRTKLYLTMAHCGGLAVVGLILARWLEWPDFVEGLFVGLMMIPLLVILVRRLRDEYLDSLWSAGTSWAFMIVVAWFLFAPFLEGLTDGVAGFPSHQDWPVGAIGIAAIAAFFSGFHLKWIKSLT